MRADKMIQITQKLSEIISDLDEDGTYEYYDYIWIEQLEVKEEEV